MGFEKKRKNAIPSATYTTHQAGQSNPIQTILGIKKSSLVPNRIKETIQKLWQIFNS